MLQLRKKLFPIVIGLLLLLTAIPAISQDWEYDEILDPALKVSMEGLRSHQVQDTMYIFYTLNMNTPGYVETGGYNVREKDTGIVKMDAFYRWRGGPPVETHRDMDIYLDANSAGFFVVQFPTTYAYTRDGRMRIDARNRLVTFQGSYPFVNANGGGYITVTTGTKLSVSKSGVVFAGDEEVGKIRAAVFTSKGLNQLVTLNGSFFVSATGEVPEEEAGGDVNYGIFQGFLEDSNVLKAIIGDIALLKRAAASVGKSAKSVARAMSSAVQLGQP